MSTDATDAAEQVLIVTGRGNTGVYHTDPDCTHLDDSTTRAVDRGRVRDRHECRRCAGETSSTVTESANWRTMNADPVRCWVCGTRFLDLEAFEECLRSHDPPAIPDGDSA